MRKEITWEQYIKYLNEGVPEGKRLVYMSNHTFFLDDAFFYGPVSKPTSKNGVGKTINKTTGYKASKTSWKKKV